MASRTPPPLIADPERIAFAASLASGSSAVPEAVDTYLTHLAVWNQQTNLVSRRLAPEDVRRLTLRAFLILPLLFPDKGIRVVDAGAGAGMVSLAIAVSRPDVNVLSVELRKRRAQFLEDVTRQLRLPRWRSRQLNVSKLPQPCCEIAIAQAMGAPVEALRLLTPAVVPGGRIVIPTGSNAELNGVTTDGGLLVRLLPAEEIMRGAAGLYIVADKAVSAPRG